MKLWADFGITLPHGDGPELYSTCPKCSHTRKKKTAKCLSINIEKGVWFCSHCQWHGTLKDGTVGAPAAPKTWTLPPPAPTPLSQSQLDWFADRGISAGTLNTAGVFGGKTYFADVEDEREAIRFPYYKAGVLYSIKSRTADKHFTRTSGGKATLFGMDAIKPGDTDTLAFCEGECDQLALAEVGIAAVSVPNGAPAASAKNINMDYLDECQEFLARFKSFIIAVDSDEPGRRLEKELSRRLGVDRCKRVVWPDDCKDANDVLVKHGPDKLRDCVAEAVEYPVVGIFSVHDLKEEMYHEFLHGETPGLHIGFDNMRGMFSMRTGEFTVVAGIPHSGKSGFVTHLATNMAQLHDWKWAIFPAEAGSLSRYANSIIELYIGKTLRPGIDGRMTQPEYFKGMSFTNDYFRFLMPEEKERTIDGILERCKSAVQRYGVKGICLDPFTEIHDGSTTDDGNVSSGHLGRQLSKLIAFTRNYGVHLILVVHPKNLAPNPKTGKIERPSGYSLYGGSHFYNKCDNMFIIHREDLSQNIAEAFVQKVRFRIVGKAGSSAYFSYNRMNGRFVPIEGR